jgi:hypothetical protein
MNDNIKQIATRVVDRLLGEEQSGQEDYDKRPGGPKDPLRQTTFKMKFKKKDFTGKRPAATAAAEDEEEKKPSRFNLKFGECKSGTGTPGKAWKKGKAAGGKPVAGKPGKVSYREALMASVLEKLKAKKGKVVAKGPGKVSYRKESEDLDPGASQEQTWEDFWMQAKAEARDASDTEYLETLLYYLQSGENEKFNGISAQQLPEVLAGISPEEWLQIGEQSPLKEQWMNRDANFNGVPDNAEPEAPQARPNPPRDRPPYTESVAEAKKKGSRIKKMLGAVAKKPGSVGYGKK